MESYIKIEGKKIQLEGKLQKKSSKKAVVICHPHPLYGGNMDNPVVMTIAEAFVEKKVSTLRMNFRGVGNSTGTFDNGVGEKKDVAAAMTWLMDKGYEQIYLAGYSFGARMTASVVEGGCQIQDHVMVSPPVGFMSFNEIETMPSTGLIVTGSNDEIAPASLVRDHLNRWKITPQFEVIQNCDHFYSGCLDKLKAILTAYL